MMNVDVDALSLCCALNVYPMKVKLMKAKLSREFWSMMTKMDVEDDGVHDSRLP